MAPRSYLTPACPDMNELYKLFGTPDISFNINLGHTNHGKKKVKTSLDNCYFAFNYLNQPCLPEFLNKSDATQYVWPKKNQFYILKNTFKNTVVTVFHVKHRFFFILLSDYYTKKWQNMYSRKNSKHSTTVKNQVSKLCRNLSLISFELFLK